MERLSEISIGVSRAVYWSAVAIMMSGAANASGLGPIGAAFSEAKPIIDTRVRYEGVDQELIAKEAEALTVRARLGFETGKAWETALLA
jgi:uncharacterized membrane protein affecting hemolysin expression